MTATIAELKVTAEQERKSAEDFLIKAKADPIRGEEYVACAALCYANAEAAELEAALVAESLRAHAYPIGGERHV